MFKKLIKGKFDGCHTIQQYLDIRKELKNINFSERKNLNFSKELEYLKGKLNVFDKMILGKSKDNYLDKENFILTFDRFDEKEHFLLIPKNTNYFNILTLEKADIHMLLQMKKFVEENIGNKLMYFHCYPFNSVHTLHLHVVDKKDYISRKNNLFIDDVIYALENENRLVLGIAENNNYDDMIMNWFNEHEISLLNIYVLSLIVIETLNSKNKKQLIPYSIDFILDTLLEKNVLDGKDKILEYFKDERETLDKIGEMMLYMCKNHHLLQSEK